jgi:tRNA(Arg) A34 adenosine deaminase TadA
VPMATVVKRARKMALPGKLLAVIFERTRIKSFAYNDTQKTKSIAWQFGYKYGLPHAEFLAILRFVRVFPRKNLGNCSMLVLRWRGDGPLGASYPCSVCWKAIEWAGIREVYSFTTDMEMIHSSFSPRLGWQRKICGTVDFRDPDWAIDVRRH